MFCFWTAYVFVLLLAIDLQCAASGFIHPAKDLRVTVKEGFIVHLRTNKEFGKIENCWYQFQEEEPIEIDLNSRVPHKRESGEEILPYSQTKCGIRLDKITPSSSGVWTLIASNSHGTNITDKIDIKVGDAPKLNFVRKLKPELGVTFVKCSDTLNSRKPDFCQLHSDTKVLSNSCESFPIVVRNRTSVKCSTLTWKTFSQSRETIMIEPVKKKVDTVIASFSETPDHVILTCQFPKNVFTCKAEMPDEVTGFLVSEGLMSGRFSSLDTSEKDGKCVFEIAKPLRPEEIGIWRVFQMLDRLSGKKYGCMFYVGSDKTKIIKKAIAGFKDVERIEIVNRTDSNKKFELSCRAPFPLELCYLADPKNEIRFPDAIRFDSSKNLGYCDFSTDLIPGEYVCGFSSPDYYDHELFRKYDVSVVSDQGEAVEPLIRTYVDKSINLLCRLPYDIIEHCIFIDPKRNIYYASNFMKTRDNSRISYHGAGLEQGYCGIRIDHVQESDIGKWVCHMQTVNNIAKAFEINIEYGTYGLSEASSIGLGVGVGGIVILFTIATIYYCRRKKATEDQDEDSANVPIQMSSRRQQHGSFEGSTSQASKES